MSHKSLVWLHLSDLHVGMASQGWLWPTFKHLLYADLPRVYARSGPIDLVIFSGDLTQQATEQEFGRLTTILQELWEQFRALGCEPMFVPIPGNHDLRRPSSSQAETIALKRWWQEPLVQAAFWSEDTNSYRTLINNAFANYSSWIGSLSAAGIPTIPSRQGLLPGDVSCELTRDGVSVGIVGLNSAWLQLDHEDYESLLHVDTRQLLSVTDDDADAWCRRHDVNFIVTHHPPGWLHPESQREWDGEVCPSGRFDAHMFGHMHTPDSVATARGGSPTRRTFQAASLFGLEKIEGKLERLHGYSVGRIHTDGSRRTYELWPRRLETLVSGARKLVPDHRFDLNDNEATQEQTDGTQPLVTMSGSSVPLKIISDTEATDDLLDPVSYFLGAANGHTAVRAIEQNACLKELEDCRAVWVVSDWGMGEDGFLAAVRARLGEERSPVYRFQLDDFRGLERFLQDFPEAVRCSFEKVCELISDKERSYIILDNIPAGMTLGSGQPVEADIDALADILVEYCPGARIFLRSRTEPNGTRLGHVKLEPLEEVDVAAYVAASAVAGSDLLQPETVGKLYRFCEGAPSRLDSALRDLKVVGLDELVSSSLEQRANGATSGDTPATLKKSISELAESDEPNLSRSFELLKALSMFPHGEELERIKRFNPARPFFPVHARELAERGLITSTASAPVGAIGQDTVSKTLTVSATVRECLADCIGGEEMESLRRRAMDLYFGPKWKTGSFSFPCGHRIGHALCAGGAILNSTSLILRNTAKAMSLSEEREVESALNVAAVYVGTLEDGDHYRSIVATCEDLLPLIPKEFVNGSVQYIKYNFAVALRMNGEATRAKQMIEEVEFERLTKRLRQSYLITKALIHENLGEDSEALSAAKRAISLDKNARDTLEAQRVIIVYSTVGDDRRKKLRALESSARRRGAILAANNVAIVLAAETDDFVEAERLLTPTLLSAIKMKDYYTATRASVNLAMVSLKQGRTLSDVEKARIIASYHFLFSERIFSVFESCHRVLWRVFSAEGDIPNLLRLFRYSSLIWRLRGALDVEEEYLALLAARIDHTSLPDVRVLNRETAYYLMRASSALTEEGRPESDAL